MPVSQLPHSLIASARKLAGAVDTLTPPAPITHVYNPLLYAREAHEAYLALAAKTKKKVVFLGMNPGPWGMTQTGVPFGEIHAVKDWMGIQGKVDKPTREHPKRPIRGFDETRSEVSGRRLWGLFQARFGQPEDFFKDHFVANYCPLVFMEETGRNFTPDKLPATERRRLLDCCDQHLRETVALLEPEWVIGVGAFAQSRAEEALAGERGLRIDKILHPSPASPAANRDWAGQVTRRLEGLSIWS